MVVSIIGIGLIGGSLALGLRETGLAHHIIGLDHSPQNLAQALALGLINEPADNLPEAVGRADLVVVAVPMDAMLTVLPQVLDVATDRQVVIDVGSTKELLLRQVADHANRARFVAVHPMAGTEHSGPEAAVPKLFEGKTLVVCDAAASAPDALARVEAVFGRLAMQLTYMSAAAHDLHAAYVSHISHISSFALALTVLQKEQSEQQIFALASGGFESTVRLAKSSPAMWVPIFRQNRDNVLDVVDEHLRQLQHLRDLLADGNDAGLYEQIEQANRIRKILK
ncbi:prephenate dehydrogenase [Hymenobacter terrestris]|uniref:Prephenate dehydrogenase n=1 Tax=Hymenobacter terrestris TaxID=2748310 RepID=A0ABX2Q713_9BACT|nr:prephenate dehydrogenase [Hymenobacter terrestris]NVO85527.1 prephenate dehydrogenase [Hymenobacter terrestris]